MARFAVVLAAVALSIAGFSATAYAQDPDSPQLEYPGPLRGVPEGQPIETVGIGSSFAAVDATPSSDPAAAAAVVGGTGGGNATLAVTGSETEPIAAIALGLLAVGGSVLVTSRRRIADGQR